MLSVASSRGSASRSPSRCGLVVAFIAILGCPSSAPAELSFARPGFTEEVVAAGLPFATSVAFANDGRIFIALKSGVVRVWRDGALLPQPFVDLSAQVNDVFDRGLLGLALHPQFPQQPYVYLLFTRDPPGVLADGQGARVARLVRVEADPLADYEVALPGMQQPQPAGCDAASPSTACLGHVVLLGRLSLRTYIGNELDGRDLSQASCMGGSSMGAGPLRLPSSDPSAAYPPGTARPIEDCLPADARTHTIGSLAFGADGSLFVSSGDGAGFNEVDPRALRSLYLDSLAGKILRIDPDTGRGLPGNPFFDADCPECNRSKVWSRGLRNPFRFAIDPNTDEPVVGDVGWNTWEEINRGRGANFGWPCYEGGVVGAHEGGDTTSLVQSGYAANPTTAAACADLHGLGLDAVQAPVFAYDHVVDGYGATNGASANAGAFYDGTVYPADLRGSLFLLDYSRRWIRTLSFDAEGRASVANFAREASAGMVQLVAGPDTNLYVIVYAGNASEVRRIRYPASGNTPPIANVTAEPSVGIAPLVVNFSGTTSFDPDAQALLFDWDFGDGATSSEIAPTHVYAEAGVYTATLRVRETTAPFAEDSASVVINAGVEPPSATISAPPPGTRFRVGERIDYSGFGSSGTTILPSLGSSWELRLHHNEHVHYSSLGSGNLGSFEADDHGDDTYYELCLTVSLLADVSDTACVDLLPLTTSLSVQSDPPGMTIVYENEGGARTTPFVVQPVVGSSPRLTVPVEQYGRTFLRWSDGIEMASRSLTVGEAPLQLTALFSQPATTCDDTAQLDQLQLTLRRGYAGGRLAWLTLRARLAGVTPTPAEHGLYLELFDAQGSLQTELSIPAGSEWVSREGGWYWRGQHPEFGSMQVVLQPEGAANASWRLRLVARGRAPEEQGLQPPARLRVTLERRASEPVTCAEVGLVGPAPLPTCQARASGRRLDCR